MSTPDPTSATAGANVLGWPDMPPATDPLPEEPAYVLWSPTGQESVFSGGGATEPVGTRARLARRARRITGNSMEVILPVMSWAYASGQRQRRLDGHLLGS